MEGIKGFKIFKADAYKKGESMVVRLFYPRNPKYLTGRISENLIFGKGVLERLVEGKQTEIADRKNPICSFSGGSIYLLSDNYIIIHRRDRDAQTYALYHSCPSGYPESIKDCYSEKGLIRTMFRETAEECILITRDKKRPRLIVSKDSKRYVLKSAKNIGIDVLKVTPLKIKFELLPPKDRLEIYDEDDKHIFSANTTISLLYVGHVCPTAFQIVKIPFSSEEVFPIDAEGKGKDGNWIHFNRESYLISLKSITNLPFGKILEKPKVFQTKIENGIPKIYVPEYRPPFWGPGEVTVTHPHVWAPDSNLLTCLDALKISGYWKRKEEIQLSAICSKIEGKNLLPEEVLIKA